MNNTKRATRRIAFNKAAKRSYAKGFFARLLRSARFIFANS